MADEEIQKKMRSVNWVPLESNPDVLNGFAHRVGLPSEFNFVDVYGVDPGLLMMVPKPVLAVTLLFGCSKVIGDYKAEQCTKIKADGQTLSSDVFYMDQFIGNACGTIACVHAMANNQAILGLPADSPIGKFLASAEGLSPNELGLALADASDIHEASETSAAGGQTAAPDAAAATDCHFICFVAVDGDLYELDGNKSFPVNHGPIPDGEDLMAAAARTIKTCFMDVDPTSMNFNMMALVQGEGM